MPPVFTRLSLQLCTPRLLFKPGIRCSAWFEATSPLASVRLMSNTAPMASARVSALSNSLSQPEDAKLRAHHNKDGSGFSNPWKSYQDRSPREIFKWVFLGRITGESKPVDVNPPTVPVHKPTFLPTRQTEHLRATWLGHACYYVEFPGGLRVLFDPVLTSRCGPWDIFGPKRYTQAPCQIEDVPFIDAVVISHNHYDHLNLATLSKVTSQHPDAHFFVPLGNKAFLAKQGIKNVTELDWWEECEFTVPGTSSDNRLDSISAVLSCLPAQHMSARTAFDRANTLWASWSISSGEKKVWFGGDTGYRSIPKALVATDESYHDDEKITELPHCPAFAEIGQHRGPFDLGLIPIGAYQPRYLMSPVHSDPYDSVNIFVDTRCTRALGMHWGTWVLTHEPVLEPPRLLKNALAGKGLDEEGVFDVCEIGESREF